VSSPHAIRIAIVAPSLRILGGHAVQARRLLDAWRADPAVDAWLVPINPLPPRPLQWMLRVQGLRTLITQVCYWPLLLREIGRADVVHVFSASYLSFLLAPLPAIAVAKAMGKPVVLHYHSGEAPDHLRRSRIARAVLRRTDLNVVPSRFLKGVFESFGISARVVANTIDLTEFAYRERGRLRPALLSTRNFEPLYNVACTLRAFARIQARHPDASLTLVGTGSEAAALQALASELRLRNVTFVGAVQPDHIYRYYADADVYVQTPSIDNMPGSVIEAFASGVPVVSTDVGGVPSILTNDEHGLLAPDNDAEAVASCVCRLVAGPEQAQRMAAAARQTCDAYAWTRVRTDWLSVYQTAFDAASSRAVGCPEST
jgi:glycosyltransferase involved in cell wall biosynthesis